MLQTQINLLNDWHGYWMKQYNSDNWLKILVTKFSNELERDIVYMIVLWSSWDECESHLNKSRKLVKIENYKSVS